MPLSKVLILGPRAHARRIATALTLAGFEPVIAPSRGTLREKIEIFARDAGASVSHFAHLVHPGTGEGNTRPELGALCQELGLAALVPSSRCQTLFSSPLPLLEFAEQRGVAHLVAAFEPVQSLREIRAIVRERELTFPIVLKNIHSGRGLGLRVAKSEEDLALRLPRWIEELREISGDATLFLESYVEAARSVEVPFVRFQDGRVRCLARVDVSLQLGGRDYVALCPAEGIDPAAGRIIEASVRQLARDANFVGVGSLEFICEGTRAWLVRGRVGLSPSFPLWEKVAGIDAVSLQLAAMGVHSDEAAAERDAVPAGALAQIYSEDPILELPRPGKITEQSPEGSWEGPSARVEQVWEFTPGESVAPDSDGFLGFTLAWAPRLKLAVQALGNHLVAPGSPTWIAGTLQTNERYLAELLQHPWVREGMFHSAFLDEEFVPQRGMPLEVACGVAQALAERVGKGPWILADRIRFPGKARAAEWTWLEVSPGGGLLRGPANERLRVAATEGANGIWWVRAGNSFFTLRRPEVRGAPATERPLRALTGGQVLALRFRSGVQAPAGEALAFLLSQHRCVPHQSGQAVKVVRWEVAPGQWVEAGAVLGWVEVVAPNSP